MTTDAIDLLDMALGVDTPQTLNIRRSLFDQMLLDQAVQAGAQLRIDTVREIQKLQDGDVSIQTADSDEPMTAKYLFDASGQATILGRHLNIRRKLPDAHLQKVAYFAHYEGVMRREKDVAGFPLVAMPPMDFEHPTWPIVDGWEDSLCPKSGFGLPSGKQRIDTPNGPAIRFAPSRELPGGERALMAGEQAWADCSVRCVVEPIQIECDQTMAPRCAVSECNTERVRRWRDACVVVVSKSGE